VLGFVTLTYIYGLLLHVGEAGSGPGVAGVLLAQLLHAEQLVAAEVLVLVLLVVCVQVLVLLAAEVLVAEAVEAGELLVD